jgi:hypothetical protein
MGPEPWMSVRKTPHLRIVHFPRVLSEKLEDVLVEIRENAVAINEKVWTHYVLTPA